MVQPKESALFYVKALYDHVATIDGEFDFQAGNVIFAVTSPPLVSSIMLQADECARDDVIFNAFGVLHYIHMYIAPFLSLFESVCRSFECSMRTEGNCSSSSA